MMRPFQSQSARRSSGGVTTKRSQTGGVLVLALALVAMSGAAIYMVYDVGAMVAAKTRLSNAADAGAYSAAVWRARALNFVAYSNRAIIAQDVAVAQALTRQSWAGYFERFTRQVHELAAIYPPAAAITARTRQAARLSARATDTAARLEIRLRDAPETGYKTLLLRSQRLLRDAAGVFASGAVALEVVKANDRRFFAFALSDDGAYKRFTKAYETTAERRRLADLTERSLDDYTRDRSRDQLLPLPATCVPTSGRARDWFAEYRKRGGTDLAADLNRWETADSGSVHNSVRKRFSLRCRRREVLAMGWGAAEAAWPAPRATVVGNPGNYRLNPLAALLARDGLAEATSRQHRGTGIARVIDLDYATLTNKSFPTSRVAVLAAMPVTRLRSAASMRFSASSLVSEPSLPGGRLWALAAAEAYFRPPPDRAKRQLASLFSPYWQARLVATTSDDLRLAGRYVAR